MRTWVTDLTGLVIGFALGGAVLLHYLPRIEGMLRPGGTTPAPVHQVQVAAVAPLPAVVGPSDRRRLPQRRRPGRNCPR